MYKIDLIHLAVFCIVTIWPGGLHSPVKIITQVQWFMYQNRLEPSSGIKHRQKPNRLLWLCPNANSKNRLPHYACLSSIASHHGMETASTQGVTLFPLRSWIKAISLQEKKTLIDALWTKRPRWRLWSRWLKKKGNLQTNELHIKKKHNRCVAKPFLKLNLKCYMDIDKSFNNPS